MTDMQPKKMIILDILNILKKYSDKEHKLSQNQIQELMESEYGMKIDRKTVRRNLSKLKECGFPIEYIGSENDYELITRSRKNIKQTILTGWYYNNEFYAGELRLLIDSVMFADGLPKRQRMDLIHKLEGLSNKYFHSTISKIDTDIYSRIVNSGFLTTLKEIGNAIANSRQVSFHYCTCGTDGNLHPKLDNTGKSKLYTVNPYQIISKNSHSYLICNIPGYDDLTHFRVDRIKDSLMLNTPSEPLRNLKAFKAGIKLSEYVNEHPNLWSGNAVPVTFQCKRYMMNDITDSFGTNLRIDELPNDTIRVHIQASEASILHWAIQFADAVEVLSPKSLREQIAETLRNALKKYEV